jgi:hypothetical protein
MKRLFAAVAVLATFTQAALAGEITLFSDRDFRGNRVTLQHGLRDLNGVGMNDRVSSFVVHSGVWQLCEHHDFGGRCAEFGPGEYRGLPNFNDAASSLREVGGRGEGGYRDGGRRGDGYGDDRGYRGEGGYRDDGRRDGPGRGEGWGRRGGGDAVELFGDRGFEGQRAGVDRDFRSLEQAGLNDRISSIIIREGRWQFCEHADFRGQCIVLGPGEYPGLEGLNDRLSSMRRVR